MAKSVGATSIFKLLVKTDNIVCRALYGRRLRGYYEQLHL